MPNKKFGVYCKTEDEAIALLAYLESEGFMWFSGRNPTSHTNWGRQRNGRGLWYCVDMSCPGHEITFDSYGISDTEYRQVQLDDLIGQRNAEISVNSICDFV